MKPLGIAFGLRDGALTVGVTGTGIVENKIWETVQEAIADGWTPEQFKREVAEAWGYELREAADDAEKVLRS